MKKLVLFAMRNEVIKLIKILGIGLNEIVIEFNLECGNFETIEYNPEDDSLVLHIFQDEDLDITFDFDDLDEEDQKQVYRTLAVLYN